MLYRLLADAVLLFHAAFIVFAVAGGVLAAWGRVPRWIVPLHLCAVAWASFVMFTGRICPLTPLENTLRRLGGEAGYATSFIEHYLLGVIYPDGLTRELQMALGAGVLLINALAYAWLGFRTRR